MKIIFIGDSLTEGTVGASFFNNLKKKLPKHKLINFGRNGDTTFSLYQRINVIKYYEPMDLTFLWVGTNDIFFNMNYENYHEEFKNNYLKILDRLIGKAEKIITVSPIYLGDERDFQWHNEQRKLSKIIKKLSEIYADVEYLDIQEIFYLLLNSKDSPKKNIKNLNSRILDDLLLKYSESIENNSIPKMLIFTIDGVHLKDLGAQVVADVFLNFIIPKD